MIKRLGCLFACYFLASCSTTGASRPPLCTLPPLPKQAVIRYDMNPGALGVTELDEGGQQILEAYSVARNCQ